MVVLAHRQIFARRTVRVRSDVLEDAVEGEGAKSPDEIRRAVKRAWKERITPDFCEATARAIWKNCGEVLRLKGGNF